MSHPAFQIVDELLQTENSTAQMRRNAAVALATIGDDDALERLLRLAMSDADASVRTAAEAELVVLCAKSPANLGPTITTALVGGGCGPSLYALIGRLHAQGAELPPLPASLPWLRLGLSLFQQTHPAFGRWSRAVRAVLPGLFAAFLGVLAALAYMQVLTELSMRSDHDVFGALGASWLFIVGPLISFGTWRTTAYRLHPRRGPGAMAEIAWACLYSAAPGVVCIAILLAGSNALSSLEGWVTAGMLFLLPPLVAGAIRAGTVAADGVLFRFRPMVGGCFAGLVGAAAGLVCVTLATGAFHGIRASLCSQIWICWFPICFGLAGAYAWIDARVPYPAAATIDGQRMAICALVLGVFFGGAVMPFLRATNGPLALITPVDIVEVAALETKPARIPLKSLPARIDLKTTGRWNLIVEVEPPPANEEAGAYLWRSSARPLLQKLTIGKMQEIDGKGNATLLFFNRNLYDMLHDSEALGAFLDAWWGRHYLPPTPTGEASGELLVTLSAFPVAPTIRYGVQQ